MMSHIWMIVIFILIVFVGIYILLWPQNFKQKISKRKNIEIRALGIFVIIFGLLFYTSYEAFRANFKLLMIIDKSLNQYENTKDACFIKSNRSITNDGNIIIYHDINLPDVNVNKSQRLFDN